MDAQAQALVLALGAKIARGAYPRIKLGGAFEVAEQEPAPQDLEPQATSRPSCGTRIATRDRDMVLIAK